MYFLSLKFDIMSFSVYQVQKGHYLFPLQVLNLFFYICIVKGHYYVSISYTCDDPMRKIVNPTNITNARRTCCYLNTCFKLRKENQE